MKKTILITGAAKQLGRAITSYYIEHDYQVLAQYYSDSKDVRELRRLGRLIGKHLVTLRGSLLAEQQLSTLASRIKKCHGMLDALILNSGEAASRPFLTYSREGFEETISDHLTALYLASKHFSPLVRPKGRIVLIGHPLSKLIKAHPNDLPFAIAKHGTVLLTKTLAQEMARKEITVNMVSPGLLFNTSSAGGAEKRSIPLKRLGDYNDIIHVIDFLLSRSADYITGTNLTVDGGYRL